MGHGARPPRGRGNTPRAEIRNKTHNEGYVGEVKTADFGSQTHKVEQGYPVLGMQTSSMDAPSYAWNFVPGVHHTTPPGELLGHAFVALVRVDRDGLVVKHATLDEIHHVLGLQGGSEA